MSALSSAVVARFEDQGLSVSQDRGAFVIGGFGEDLAPSVWVDETERVVKAEAVLCYPIDDFSPELCRAMDYLNRRRAGITYFYRDANRAIFAQVSWTSPTRDPSANQAHLMMALLCRAHERDAPTLARVAEGEASWEEVVDPDEPATSTSLSAATAAPTAGSGTDTTRWTQFMELADEPATPSRAWRRDAITSDLGSAAGVAPQAAFDEMPTRRLEPATPAEGIPTRRFDDGGAQPAEVDGEPKRLSRQALHFAVYQAEHREHAKQDLTVAQRSLLRRSMRVLIPLLLVCGVVTAFYRYYAGILDKSLFGDLGQWFHTAVQDPEDVRTAERAAMPAGRDLLALEIQDPLADAAAHRANLERCLQALAEDEVAAALESLMVRGAGVEARQRAYHLWGEKGFLRQPGGRLRVLEELVKQGVTSSEDPIVRILLISLRERPPQDPGLIAALAWAEDEVWSTAVELLGKPGPGAEARAQALGSERSREGRDEFQVIRALVKTGHIPRDAAERLVAARGVEWAAGEGEGLLLEVVRADPATTRPLLADDDEELRSLAVGLLTSSAAPGSAELLIQTLQRDASARVRLKAALGLGSLADPATTWEVATALQRVQSEDQPLADELRRTLRKIPGPEAAAALRPHLAPDLQARERYYAVVALGELQAPAAVQVLIEDGLRDSDPRVRLKALHTLLQLQKFDTTRSSLARGLSEFRSLARNDDSGKVREMAARLYKSISGHDP